MVYITSFVLTSQPRIATAEALTEKALLQGARLCLNLSSVGLLQKVKESLMNLLPKCSFLFGNRGELHAFAELMGWTSDSDVDMMRCLATLLPGMAVITAGAEPTMVAVDGDVQLFPVPQSLEQKTGHVVGINKIWRLSKLKPVFWICFQRFWILTYDVHGFVSRQTTRSCESIAFGDLQV